jgi:hypothetical protein
MSKFPKDAYTYNKIASKFQRDTNSTVTRNFEQYMTCPAGAGWSRKGLCSRVERGRGERAERERNEEQRCNLERLTKDKRHSSHSCQLLVNLFLRLGTSDPEQ